MTGSATFSLVWPGNARQLLGVSAASKIPKTGTQLPIFDTMHFIALEKRWCKMVQRAKTLTKPVVLFFLHLHAKAKSLCTILTDPILTLKSSMIYFYSFDVSTNCVFSAHLVKWITKNNQPANIVNDRELHELLTARWPHIELPGHITISWDIKACFNKCRNCVAKLLHVHFWLQFFFKVRLIIISCYL